MPSLTAIPSATARWSARHPWRAIGGWLAFVALAVGLAMVIPTKSTTEADYRLGDSGRAQAILEAGGLRQPDAENVLITSRSGPLPKDQVSAVGRELTTAMSRIPTVAQVAEPVWSADRSAALVPVTLKTGADEVAPLLAATATVQAAHPGLEIRQGGDLSIQSGINDRVAEDLHTAEFLSIPATLVLMLLAFGALIAAGVPVLLAGTAVGASMGLAAPISYLVHAEPTVNSMIGLVGMAVGVDYSLFYLKREREEREKGASTVDAVEIAARTSGHAILVSGGAVIVSMASLYLVGAATFNSLATGAIVVVAVAVLGSITVLPALLVKLGTWVDRPRIPLLWRMTRGMQRGAVSSRLTAPVLRHPAVALLVALAATAALAVPALGMRVHGASLETLPGDIPAVATAKRIAEEFPSRGTSAVVVVRADAQAQSQVAAALTKLAGEAERTAYVEGASADAIRTSADRTVTRLDLPIPFGERDSKTENAIHDLRNTLVPNALHGITAEYAVGGSAAENLDFVDRQSGRMSYVVGLVLLLTLVVMFGAFRSLPLALVSAGLNLLSVGAAFGVLRLVFQDGRFTSLLDYTSPGYVIDWIPLFVLAILVGLSMDYHVFVTSRIREWADTGLPMREAVRRGLADTAGVVTSAAAVMIAVFSIFVTLSMLEMKMMGVGLAAAILVDATLVRLVLLPAALVLLGERVWPRAAAHARPDRAPMLEGASGLVGAGRR